MSRHRQTSTAPAATAAARIRAETDTLRIRISQLARIYPPTYQALVGALIITEPARLNAAVLTVEAALRNLISPPPANAPADVNPIRSAVEQIVANRQENTMAKQPNPTIRVEFIPTEPDTPYPLGRAGIHHDSRNRNFRALVQPPPRTDRPGRAWATSVVFDQQDQNCTAEAAIGLCKTYPHRLAFTPDWPAYDEEAERIALYREAQLVDPFPQTPPADGSSTDAPFRILRDRGQIAEWRWLFGEGELWDYVTNYGPACVGTYWYRSMFTPTPMPGRGGLYLNVDPGSGIAGGHAWRIVQAHGPRLAYRMVNSWGKAWGESGRAWITREAMAALLAADGEAVTIREAV